MLFREITSTFPHNYAKNTDVFVICENNAQVSKGKHDVTCSYHRRL